MSAPDLLLAMTPVIEGLEALGVPYHVGGSVASSIHGVGRSTLDVDIIADLRTRHAHPLVETLRDTYFVQLEDVREAISRRASFNVVHLATMLKVDIFVPPDDPFDQAVRQRTIQEAIEETAEARLFNFPSPEDVVLQKLRWFRTGGEVASKQYADVLGVLKLQGKNLDRTYLRRWAAHLSIVDLVDHALQDAGL